VTETGAPARVSAAELRARRKTVEETLHALGRPRPPRRAPPPEGRLGADEQPAGRLRAALAALGPVFDEFGRYLSTRVDLLPRRDCLDLATADLVLGDDVDEGSGSRVSTSALELVTARGRHFHEIDPVPRRLTRWTQQHEAWLAPSVPVTVRIVRPDADQLLSTDLPLLPLLGPWLDIGEQALADAIDDFSQTLRVRLDQTEQAAALIRLAEDARGDGALDAPVCYRDYCTARVLTIERVAEVPITDARDGEGAARRFASAWLRQAISGRVVPFDFDWSDVRLRDDRLVFVAGALEPMTADGRERFLRYLVAAAADDPDAAWDWIADAAEPLENGEPGARLRSRLRQAVPFRDGEWSGDDRFAERLLVHWRVVAEARWKARRPQLHLYRGIQAVSELVARLAPDTDPLLEALENERLRLGTAEVQKLIDPRELARVPDQLLHDLVQLPQKLDEFLTLAADGRLRVKLHIPDAGEGRRVRNRTVSLLSSLVTLIGVWFLVRHLSPALGPDVERVGTLLLLIIGGWLLIAAARL
jgi:predicted unusual protein kinase regulating ubiquinone biosynthesis (AarF/ABC1/UbiB family)